MYADDGTEIFLGQLADDRFNGLAADFVLPYYGTRSHDSVFAETIYRTGLFRYGGLTSGMEIKDSVLRYDDNIGGLQRIILLSRKVYAGKFTDGRPDGPLR